MTFTMLIRHADTNAYIMDINIVVIQVRNTADYISQIEILGKVVINIINTM